MRRFRTATLPVLTLAALTGISACSAIPEDIRATLPESMRGDTKALTDYATPELSGRWSDKDYPELTISLTQSGSSFKFTRAGSYREIPVNGTFTGTLDGRSVKVTYEEIYSGKLRPVKGQCFGVVSKDSSSIGLTCDDSEKGSYPMTLTKS